MALLIIDGLVLCTFKPYLQRAIRMAFSARAMRFVTLSRTMRRLAGALFQTVVPILTVLAFCASLACKCHGFHFRQNRSAAVSQRAQIGISGKAFSVVVGR